MDSVRIFDTTLRDGEQSPGFSMNTPEKIRMARQLAKLGVDVIEAGFPIASRGDLEAVRMVAQEVRNVPIAALARARRGDGTAAVEALEPAAASRLHVFLATSDLHLRVKLNMTRQQALEAIGSMIRLGRQRVGEGEFSAEDAGRTDIDFLCQVCRVAVDAGATILNLPDTVGYAVPEEYGAMFRQGREFTRTGSSRIRRPTRLFRQKLWECRHVHSCSGSIRDAMLCALVCATLGTCPQMRSWPRSIAASPLWRTSKN